LKLKLSSGNAVPDICLYPRQPRKWEKDLVFRTDAPLLTIEILSPRQSFDDIADKIHDIYFPAGVKSAWMIMPAVQSVMLFVLGQKVQLFNAGMLHDPASGFSLDVDKLFA
jgi:Uma2 family endonuclease